MWLTPQGCAKFGAVCPGWIVGKGEGTLGLPGSVLIYGVDGFAAFAAAGDWLRFAV